LSHVHGNEIIFEDGDWKIASLDQGTHLFFDKVYHKCPWKENWLGKNKYQNIYTMTNLSHCSHCGTEIPDSIMGVWKLKNFDLLQVWSEPVSGFYLHGTSPTISKRPPPK
jgi:hypothetical protein